MKKKKHIPQAPFLKEKASEAKQQDFSKDIKKVGKLQDKNTGPNSMSGLRKSQRKG